MNISNISDEILISRRKEICDKLIARRLELNLSQDELAEKMGISRSSVSKIENAEWNFGISFLIAFCEALNLTIELY